MYVRMYLRMLGSSTATVTEFPENFLVFEKWQDLNSDHRRNSEQGVCYLYAHCSQCRGKYFPTRIADISKTGELLGYAAWRQAACHIVV
jgi:hypothetical protein